MSEKLTCLIKHSCMVLCDVHTLPVHAVGTTNRNLRLALFPAPGDLGLCMPPPGSPVVSIRRMLLESDFQQLRHALAGTGAQSLTITLRKNPRRCSLRRMCRTWRATS